MLMINTVVKKIKYIFILSVFLQACSLSRSSEEVDESDAVGQSYSKTIGNYTFKATPCNSNKLIAINYKDKLEAMSKSAVDSVIKEYNNYLCFIFEINIEGFDGDIVDYDEPNNEIDYTKKLNYYLFSMQNDFNIKDDKGKSSACIIYYFERLNELTRSNKFIVGFNNSVDNNFTFQYSPSLLKCGDINFNINKNHLALN